ncbi:3-hydroxyacyl-CoA dehydrogenase NAD-binding domain-containing protein [Sinorhizobium meliloti]|uniref:Fatty oxidation complex alpha subunit includes: enoyl-CoA hydratase, 3-hydroxyacyl-CoA dehydrogenase, 3-hydroxybutyryl-CoA epimerase transmembrane protein n=4 Tax=Rhizobium meliloti TaxID=382 RepID=Q92S88_RHIME|nr:3-hydroxyacyl-CoA dehydrogenase NAD-binding domain-containing protein [Sinorhizobium meliloti]TWA96767.1 3-hydroxyacyl-CoA dehydrogenase [Ensifer sp. SEMIA 134]TWB32578.1 3-hydroxyacyl-CoA dehydrogenase [Ensifer sp. SEMIA 135]AEG03097.1 3-hydroxybutyryl-CoA epimerase [Sinorhizobium meliloti BL225C]AGA05501.1 bifunctional 3-hydroxyacyl-CoA dehydrogenase [Sinorhizobium meliloti GR4]AGG73112.1 Putative fatty oxidation complex alpha subunit [Sinorhizobium meliloti 2011]
MSYTNFKIETDADGIALVTWDMPDKSMNVFTEEVMKELDAIIDQTTADPAVKGVVITSGKSSFSGGADLSMIKSMFTFQAEERKKDPDNAARKLFDLVGRMTGLFRKLETSGKPWVSAINGTCMGGAFEMSLACHGRVASNAKSVKIALPEVKVGIFPGAGGTQRVPRLTNTQDALQMMTTGSSLTPARAKAMGLVHEVVDPDKLIEAAKAMIKNGLKPVQPWDEKGFKLPGGGIWTPASAQLWPAASGILRRETYGNYPGAIAILKCVYEGLQVPFDTALKIEQRYFTEILQTTEAFSMIRSLFVSMQELGKGARRPAGVPKTELKKVGVVGAGFMGASIAYVTAAGGIPVTLIDRDMEAAEKGKTHSEGLVKDAIGKGRLTKEEGEALLSRITPSADYGDLRDAGLVIEAVFEDRQVKKDVIEKVEAVIAEDAIFASNTSTLPITGLARNSKRPDRFIGIHFFSPVEKMMLTEVILGKETGDRALAAALDYVAAIRKTPIVVNDTRGFYVNRCVFRYIHEAYDMLIEGVPPAMIENAAKMAGMPVGPLSLNDEVAIDLSQKILKAAVADLGDKAVDLRHMALIDKMVDELDRRGRKNGKGFYEYPAKPARKYLWPGLKELYPQKDAGEIEVGVLKQRLLVTIALEAARTIEEGIVTDPREADVGSILGFGFAPYTGGTLSYIDGMGAKAFVELCEKLAADHGDHFRPTPLLKEMAEKGETFYGRFDPYGAGQKAA